LKKQNLPPNISYVGIGADDSGKMAEIRLHCPDKMCDSGKKEGDKAEWYEAKFIIPIESLKNLRDDELGKILKDKFSELEKCLCGTKGPK
jgi:hypothetical protein